MKKYNISNAKPKLLLTLEYIGTILIIFSNENNIRCLMRQFIEIEYLSRCLFSIQQYR